MGLANPVSPTAITIEANMTSNASDKSHSRIAAESARAAGAIQKGYDGEGLWFCDGEAVISVRALEREVPRVGLLPPIAIARAKPVF